MNYYSLPFTPKPGEQSRLPKVSTEESVQQHIRLMLATMPGSYRFAPVYGSLLNKHHFLLPDKRKGDKRLEQELKLKLQENLKFLIDRYEPRLKVEEIEVGIGLGREDAKPQKANNGRIVFSIAITGSIDGRNPYRHTESFFLK